MNINEVDHSEKNHYIYLWKYPVNINEGQIFYVGQGKHGRECKYVRSRAIHYLDGKRRRSYAQNVFDKIIKSGDTPVIEIYADNLSIAEANEIEKSLIKQFGRRNDHTGILCNLTAGGEINPMNDPDIRLKQLNSVRTPEHRAKRSIEAKVINSRPDVLQKNIESNKRRWGNAEFKSRMIAKHNSPEMLEKHRRVQSELSGIKIFHDGIEYRSKNELARVLGMSLQMLSYRLKNNIPLDAPKNYRQS